MDSGKPTSRHGYESKGLSLEHDEHGCFKLLKKAGTLCDPTALYSFNARDMGHHGTISVWHHIRLYLVVIGVSRNGLYTQL